ncbi:DUF1552 domain-containing protein [Rubripirellula sp.]|nr:DUF1552 domain-containing protein [Rubripirellula sp.]
MSQKIDRRMVLRGAGAIAIGLPFLEEMCDTAVAAADSARLIPERAFNLFFGLGIPAPLQQEGFEGVLEPLKPLRDKLLILRGVDHVRADEKGINAHYDGATAAFTAEPPDGEAKAGGPSIDQVIRHAIHPGGLPPGMVPTLVAGTFFRRSRVGRYVHSYNFNGTVAGTMQERPRDLFERVFGRVNVDEMDDPKQQRLRRSVLDSVLEQYRHMVGARSPLGATSKTRVNEHLDRIREYEQRAYGSQAKMPRSPDSPDPSILLHGGSADPGGEGIDITLDELVNEWRLMADLYATAVKMDRARFGSLTFLAAGERIRLQGDYHYEDRKVFVFDDAKQRNASGSKGCSHEWWHEFREKQENQALRAHAHLKMRELAYFLNALDDSDAIDANGKTILENSLITISTESGDGRHNDVQRELSGVFHAITGAKGRFRTGEILDVNSEGIDVYNTVTGAIGAQYKMGPEERPVNVVDSLLV